MKALPLVLALVLVASPVIGAAGPGTGDLADTSNGTTQVQTSSNGTVRVLDIPDSSVVRSTVDAQHVDLGPSIDFAGLRAGSQIQTLSSLERIESASDEGVRQQLILGEINQIEQRAIALQSAQQNAIEAYNSEDIAARELLVELARIDAEARELNERRVELREAAAQTPDFSVDPGRLAALERELDTFTGPVRKHAAAVLTGNEPSMRFFVRTSADGLVLSVISDNTYIREAYRSDLRDRDQSGVTPTQALDKVAENYPLVWNSRATQNGADVVGAGNSYLVRVNHGRGQLFAYVDSGSAEVFKEAQIRPLDTVSNGTVATEVKDGLRLSANRTYPGGPLRIQLNETETGDSVDANVTLGLEASRESTLLGRTGSDGAIWTVSPASRFTITVIRGNAAVVLTVSPTPVPQLATNETQTNETTLTPTQRLPADNAATPEQTPA
ncbi:hypothetical protein C453_03724 [Haloferax elongans ATCC BAA-1513]|uniref:Uncharacterized protein n=1 Tax=Haloferax elongans ATCC BAA-1513 TaxID=1230453 RepID=M0HWD0_HALEO|nr:hypothetical protein [Haloferax elongans]ELZ87429.1 hypothetical protein C453_03724 [Haloferax elongans ATCC BAA-1513]